jgi:fumarate reductase subunit D
MRWRAQRRVEKNLWREYKQKMMKLGPIEKLALFALIVLSMYLSYERYKVKMTVANNVTSSGGLKGYAEMSIIDAVIALVFLLVFMKLVPHIV